MGILLFIVGLLAVCSGLLKLRRRSRAIFGVTYLPAAEALLGALTVIGAGLGLATVRPFAWFVAWGVLGLVILSSGLHVRQLVRLQQTRSNSEENRLREYVQIRSRVLEGIGGNGDHPPGGPSATPRAER